jgi:hypothetical protein
VSSKNYSPTFSQTIRTQDDELDKLVFAQALA